MPALSGVSVHLLMHTWLIDRLIDYPFERWLKPFARVHVRVSLSMLCILLQTYTYIYSSICVYVYIYIYTHANVYRCLYIILYIHLYIYKYIYIYICIPICIHMFSIWCFGKYLKTKWNTKLSHPGFLNEICLSDASQMCLQWYVLLRCLSDISSMRHAPQMPLRCLLNEMCLSYVASHMTLAVSLFLLFGSRFFLYHMEAIHLSFSSQGLPKPFQW